MENITGFIGPILIIGLISFLIWIWVLSEIIKGATKSARNLVLQETQVKLLVSIAIKLGVPNEVISKDTESLGAEDREKKILRGIEEK